MYQPIDLYERYKERASGEHFSGFLPDTTSKITLDHINYAINLCDKWDSSLDVGAGAGQYTAALSSKFRKNVAIEIDHSTLHDNLTQKYKNIIFHNIFIEEYNTNEKFDFILLMDIFEHIKNIDTFIQKLSDLQEKNGIIYLVTPNPYFCGPASESEMHYDKIGYLGHIKHYTKKEVIEIMKKFNYEPEFIIYEETRFRDYLKRITKGLSRRDKKYSNYSAYRALRPLFHFILKIIFQFIEYISYKKEKSSENDIFNTMSIGIAFKKQK